MPLNLTRVHDWQRIPGTMDARLIGVTPYIRLTQGHDPPMYLQAGRVWSEGGEEVQVRPEWLEAAIAGLTPKARLEVGFALPEDGPAPPPAKPMYVCPEDGCGAVVPLDHKGFHIGGHRRRGGAHGDRQR